MPKQYLPDKPIWESQLSTAEKIVLLAIKYHVNGNPRTYVSVRTIARDTGLGRATIFRVLKVLKLQRWIDVNTREHQTSEYRLVFSKFVKGGAVTVIPPPSHGDTIPVSQGQTKYIEPSIDNQDKSLCDTLNQDKEIYPDQKGMKIGEALAIGISKKGSKTSGVSALESIWNEIPLIYDEKPYIEPLTMKDRGMMKHFVVKVGERHVEVFRNAVHHWHEYTDMVCINTGAKGAPGYPHLGYLLKNVGEAVNFVPPVKAPKKPVQLIAPVAKVEPPKEQPKKPTIVKPKKMTPEELDAVLAEMEKEDQHNSQS